MKFFIFYIIILFEKTIQKYLYLNLGKDNEKLNKINNYKTIKDEEIIEILFYNDIFTLINVGKPKKEVKLFLTFSTNQTILNIKEYSPLRSITYKINNITNKSSDLFEFNNKYSINNYLFNLLGIKENNKSNDKCILGFKPTNINNNNINISNNTNILFQLKNSGLIDRRVFSIIYDEIMILENKFKRERLLIGEIPEKINLNEIKWMKLNNDSINQKWKININSFIYNNYNKTTINNIYIEFFLENNLIIGPEYFRLILLDDFLNKLISKEICKEDYFYNERTQSPYIYYECKQIDIFKNKIIYFKNKELNETFEINLGDLFYRYNQKLFFGIIFDINNKKENNVENVWKMGKLFYEKYLFVFDDDNNRIGYHKIEEELGNPYIIMLCFGIFLFFIIFLIIIGYLSRNKKNNDFINKKTINIEEKKSNSTITKVNNDLKEKIE